MKTTVDIPYTLIRELSLYLWLHSFPERNGEAVVAGRHRRRGVLGTVVAICRGRDYIGRKIAQRPRSVMSMSSICFAEFSFLHPSGDRNVALGLGMFDRKQQRDLVSVSISTSFVTIANAGQRLRK